MGVPEDVRCELFRELDALQDVVHEADVQGPSLPCRKNPGLSGFIVGSVVPGPAALIPEHVVVQDLHGALVQAHMADAVDVLRGATDRRLAITGAPLQGAVHVDLVLLVILVPQGCQLPEAQAGPGLQLADICYEGRLLPEEGQHLLMVPSL